MRPLMLIPLAAFLALAACDDTQDVAQTEPEVVTTEPTDTATAPPPATTETVPPADTAAAPPPPSDTAAAPPPPTDTASAPPPTVTTAPAQDMAAAPPPATEPQATGAVSAGASIQPGTYQAQDVSLDLGQDGTFTLTNPTTGDEAQGEYQLEGSVLTLMTEGDPAEPMTCEVVPSGEGFEISATDPSCEPLDGQMFQPQG